MRSCSLDLSSSHLRKPQLQSSALQRKMSAVITIVDSEKENRNIRTHSQMTWFRVRVPVLSLHIVVAEPIVSQAESLRTCRPIAVIKG